MDSKGNLRFRTLIKPRVHFGGVQKTEKGKQSTIQVMSQAGWTFTPPTTLRDVPQASYGEHAAVIVPEEGDSHSPSYTVTYATLAKEVESVARQLRALLSSVPTKNKSEAVVALAMINNVEFTMSFLGVTWAGAATAPLNPQYKVDEFTFYLEDNGVDVLLISPEGNEAAVQAGKSLKVPIYQVQYNPSTQLVSLINLDDNAPSLAPESQSPSEPLPLPAPEHSVMYMHTSGTTSRPKRVQLTHRNLVSSLHNIQRTYELSPDDRTLLVMPLFHVHGLIAGMLTTLASGGTMIMHGRFAASKFWSQVVAHGATWYTAVPTIHQILLIRADTDFPKDKDKQPALRFIRSCSASLAASVLERLESAFHAPVLEAYAMTENAHQMTSNPLPKYGPRKPGSVGKATFIELAILDDACNELAPGKEGEVCIRGASVTPGYVNNPKANEEGFEGGWFHTGDQGKLDEEGYLTLTGRIKELINRGGEKISPLEIDAVLLSHPKVAEAVSFAAPDPKYGEEVNAVVTVKPGESLTEAEVLQHCEAQLADFKLPKKLYIATDVPRTATGKIQRRIVAEHFLTGGPAPAPAPASSTDQVDGYMVTARALYAAGVRYMFGVVGIPVTRLAPCAQEAGIRFISFRNEQPASYAASAAGYITGHPAALLTVSGPGVIHGLAGLANAGINSWPVIMLSGSTPTPNVGRGGFQELDQLEAARPHAKKCFKATSIDAIAGTVADAVKTSLEGRPGGVYVDLPADVLHQKLGESSVVAALGPIKEEFKQRTTSEVLDGDVLAALESGFSLLRSAKRPLLVLGKGAAYSRAEVAIREFVDRTGIPFLATPMGKGVVPDEHPLNAAAARSLVLKQADVVLVVGARLNWILHFGEPPRWNPDVKFVVVDVDNEAAGAPNPKRLVVQAPAQTVMAKINKALTSSPIKVDGAGEWVSSIKAKVEKNSASMAGKLAKVASPMDYHTVYAVLLRHLSRMSPQPIVVSEGANTMDIGRSLISISEPRTRLDAGTWGTMGVGLGYAIAAAVVDPSRLVVAIEGDSAFGFSGMEIETICRYNLRVVIIIFNNNGIYGGKFESEPGSAFPKDPLPTAFVQDARYDLMSMAFGGLGYFVQNPTELDAAVTEAFASGRPAIINVDIDPFCGTESGSLTDHN